MATPFDIRTVQRQRFALLEEIYDGRQKGSLAVSALRRFKPEIALSLLADLQYTGLITVSLNDWILITQEGTEWYESEKLRLSTVRERKKNREELVLQLLGAIYDTLDADLDLAIKVEEIAEQIGFDRSTAAAIFGELCRRGLLQRKGEGYGMMTMAGRDFLESHEDNEEEYEPLVPPMPTLVVNNTFNAPVGVAQVGDHARALLGNMDEKP